MKFDKFCIWGCMQVREDEQLLLFALKHAEQFEPLGRWIELQLETNPALASLKEVAAEYSASPPSHSAVTFLDHPHASSSPGRFVEMYGI